MTKQNQNKYKLKLSYLQLQLPLGLSSKSGLNSHCLTRTFTEIQPKRKMLKRDTEVIFSLKHYIPKFLQNKNNSQV